MLKPLLFTAILGFSVQACAHENHQNSADTAKAILKNADYKAIGHVKFEQGSNGVLVGISAQNISEGWHAIHVHEIGDCSGEGFKSTGGHAAGAHSHHHGFMEGKGLHAGDMPNIWAHADGSSKAQAFLHDVKLTDLLDEDGAAVIIHENADDYASQPSGAAGARIACGVINE